jgi:hypothetical protein
MPKQSIAVLVLSCDKYADLWSGFFQCFAQNWPDCPYPIYLANNLLPFEAQLDLKVNVLHAGRDQNWSTSLKNILAQIPEEHLLILLEDTWLTQLVATQKLKIYWQKLRQLNYRHAHLWPTSRPDSWLDGGLGIYAPEQPYRVNVLGWWRKSYLLSLLIPGESPWNFEIMGSYRTSYVDGFYCLPKGIVTIINTVEKGYWQPRAVRYAQEQQLKVDFTQRKVRGGGSLWRSKCQVAIFNAINVIPWRWRVKTMSFLRKLLVSY